MFLMEAIRFQIFKLDIPNHWESFLSGDNTDLNPANLQCQYLRKGERVDSPMCWIWMGFKTHLFKPFLLA